MAMLTRIAAPLIATAGLVLAVGATAQAQIKTLGRLRAPEGAKVIAVSTDPVLQRALNDRLRQKGIAGRPGDAQVVTLTVTMHAKVLAPGVALGSISPGDPSIAGMLEALGLEAPPVGDAGTERLDPIEAAARRRATMPADPMIESYREELAMRDRFERAAGGTAFESMPKHEIYDTVVVARATLSSGPEEFKLVALVHPGDDPRAAKAMVAQEVADAIRRP
jgi:hypothetical protein